MKTIIILEIETEKHDPDLLDKVAGRAYTLSNVKDIEGRIVWQEPSKAEWALKELARVEIQPL